MTIRRLRQQGETRSSMLAGWPNGYGYSDPAAIPPPGNFQMQRAGVPVTPHTAMQVDVVHTALRVISNAIINMRDARSYTVSYDPQNRPYRVWDNPQPVVFSQTFGPDMFQYDGRRRTVISMGLFGEAFWYVIERDFYNFPRTVEVLAPMFIEVKKDKTTGKQVWTYGSGQDKVVLDKANLIHIPFMAMPGASRGLSSIEFGGINFALALAAMEYGQRWFAQGASPSYLLSTEGKLGPDEVKRIAETFLIEHSGLQSAHLPLVVDSGLKVEKISSTPDEAQYLATLEYSRSTIGAWFGLPSHLIGGANDKGNVWGKTVQEQGYQMQDYTLSGYVVPLEEAHSSLTPRGHHAHFDQTHVTRSSDADKAALITAERTAAVKTSNDLRADSWLPPVEGGDNIAQPLNSNMAPAPDPGQQAESEDNAGGNAGGMN
jgi:HK97 family phage portal protein